jgi:hypothetical protein
MHTLVRKAASSMLLKDPNHRDKAEEGLVRGMAEVGRAMARETRTESKLLLARSELPNILRLGACQHIPKGGDSMAGLKVLANQLALVDLAYEAAGVYCKVRHFHLSPADTPLPKNVFCLPTCRFARPSKFEWILGSNSLRGFVHD